MIPDNIKAQVKKQILRDLESYWVMAEEHEDQEVQDNQDLRFRVDDFYTYVEVCANDLHGDV